MPALAAGQPAAEYADTLVAPWNDLDALRELFAEHGARIAGVITEPLLANSGCCEPRPGYLESLLEIAHTHGGLVIFDEVITGSRLALGGAREYYGLTPDLSVYAKAIAGGFPLAAIAGNAAEFAPLLDGRTVHSGSNNGSPVTVAAARRGPPHAGRLRRSGRFMVTVTTAPSRRTPRCRTRRPSSPSLTSAMCHPTLPWSCRPSQRGATGPESGGFR